LICSFFQLLTFWYMLKFKIFIDKEKCIGCGSCAAICPLSFEVSDEGKAKAKKEEIEELGCSQSAAESCPVQAIKVEPIREK